ncbi:hypothetical protein [Paraburkholderia sediminicola]|uniref:hypothetical protein n=1 Tax=Paraburkholderia sediminicola TaxID=458836 RepID=UPI0038BA8C32
MSRHFSKHVSSWRQAMGVPKDRSAAASALAVFIEDMKAQGNVAASLTRSGQTAAVVAPPAAI